MRVRLKLVLIICLLFLLSSTSVNAAYFKFEPESKSAPAGERVEISIIIDTETELPTVADAVIIFNSAKLHLVEVKEPSQSEKFFPKFLKRVSENKVYIGGAIDPGTVAKAGRGVLGVLVFEMPESGSGTLTFACEAGKSTDSNISLKNSAKIVVDLLDCKKINTATITTGGATGSSPTPTTRLSASPNPQLSSTPIPATTLTPRLSATPTSRLSPTGAGLTTTITPTLSLTGTVLTATPTLAKLPISGETATTTTLIKAGLILAGAGLIIKYFISLR